MRMSILKKFFISFLLFFALSFMCVYLIDYFYFTTPDSRQYVNIMYIVYFITIALSLIIFLSLILIVYRPLKKIRVAAMEYARGNFEYDDYDVKSGDEIGDVAASLKYMSSQLSNTRDYQKDFISNISHDFRSPLTSIKGYLEAMIDGTIAPADQRKYLQIVLSEANRLENLTTGLLSLNDYGTDGMELIVEDFDMEQVVTEAVETFEGRCRKKNIQLIMQFPDDHFMVNGDKGKYAQVLYNLLDNAYKFSPSQSQIIITIYNKNDRQYCSVKDFGSGIKQDQLDKIWQRFYKSDTSRGRDKAGSGIGLAIVKEIMMAHGETIDVISTEGVGCEFIFSLKQSK
ncbi:MAG: HAMP domain-containing histidine kinase [Eubacterium sp.]|nr:HAMP domain-containing histidine kinase [Eubacterium sp.]